MQWQTNAAPLRSSQESRAAGQGHDTGHVPGSGLESTAP